MRLLDTFTCNLLLPAASLRILTHHTSQSEDRPDRVQDLQFRQIAASLQPVKAALTGASQRSVSRELALSIKREIGDCYIWGSWSGEPDGSDPADGVLQCCGLPTMVANTHALDVIQVGRWGVASAGRSSWKSPVQGVLRVECLLQQPTSSCVQNYRIHTNAACLVVSGVLWQHDVQVAVGPRHAALLTRGGEVYSWGAGLGGNMGNGTAAGSNYPQQVSRLCCRLWPLVAALLCRRSYAGMCWDSACLAGAGRRGGVSSAVASDAPRALLRGCVVSQHADTFPCVHASCCCAFTR